MGNNEIQQQSPHRWFEGAIVYHIYPRSLQDSNNDGIGDIKGITQRLDYFKELGVNALWLSPFYPSPMADFGYDVADYCDVDPIFGTLDDFKELLQNAEKENIKIIIDLVPNHTSDEHEWFKQSRQSRDNDYADWYIWRDPHTDDNNNLVPPNNWRDALTGGSAWQWDEKRGQYYLHSFDVKQPDLNWSNQHVREAVKDAMRFWLDLGVDGFRVDAVYWMAKDPLMRDDSMSQDYIEGEDPPYEALAHENSRGWPAVYAYLSEMSEVLKEEKYHTEKHRFMVTEAYPERHNPVASYMAFYIGIDPEVAAPFNFEGVSLPWTSVAWHRFLKSFHSTLSHFGPHCVASYAFGNHDQPRLISRIGEDAARSAAVMLLTLPGMAFIYYGEEIGMRDSNIPTEYIQDPAAKGDAKKGQGRDPERTPMQWNGEKNAGFSDADSTWLPVAPDYATYNVEAESKDPGSFLSLYRSLGKLRNESMALRHGPIEVLDIDSSHVVAYVRSDNEGNKILVAINFSSESSPCSIPDYKLEPIVSSNSDSPLEGSITEKFELLPHEAVVFSVA